MPMPEPVEEISTVSIAAQKRMKKKARIRNWLPEDMTWVEMSNRAPMIERATQLAALRDALGEARRKDVLMNLNALKAEDVFKNEFKRREPEFLAQQLEKEEAVQMAIEHAIAAVAEEEVLLHPEQKEPEETKEMPGEPEEEPQKTPEEIKDELVDKLTDIHNNFLIDYSDIKNQLIEEAQKIEYLPKE